MPNVNIIFKNLLSKQVRLDITKSHTINSLNDASNVESVSKKTYTRLFQSSYFTIVQDLFEFGAYKTIGSMLSETRA